MAPRPAGGRRGAPVRRGDALRGRRDGGSLFPPAPSSPPASPPPARSLARRGTSADLWPWRASAPPTPPPAAWRRGARAGVEAIGFERRLLRDAHVHLALDFFPRDDGTFQRSGLGFRGEHGKVGALDFTRDRQSRRALTLAIGGPRRLLHLHAEVDRVELRDRLREADDGEEIERAREINTRRVAGARRTPRWRGCSAPRRASRRDSAREGVSCGRHRRASAPSGPRAARWQRSHCARARRRLLVDVSRSAACAAPAQRSSSAATIRRITHLLSGRRGWR